MPYRPLNAASGSLRCQLIVQELPAKFDNVFSAGHRGGQPVGWRRPWQTGRFGSLHSGWFLFHDPTTDIRRQTPTEARACRIKRAAIFQCHENPPGANRSESRFQVFFQDGLACPGERASPRG